MQLTGKNYIGNSLSFGTGKTFKAFSPEKLIELNTDFYEASEVDAAMAMEKAAQAFKEFKLLEVTQRAKLLEQIALEIEELGDALIQRVCDETGLPEARIVGERGRTCGQLRLFASYIRDGHWVEATIDTADEERLPAPKPDIRSCLQPIGPVVVFAASNFPLAFSVAGGDTASALAAGNPVVVKAHPSHPGSSEWVAHAIQTALQKLKLSPGIFSMLHGTSYNVGEALVLEHRTKAVGFTGSLQGGLALSKLNHQRKEPIPIFTEMGSVNPVFIFKGILKEKTDTLATQLAQSITLGTGQFCTQPGLIMLEKGADTDKFKEILGKAIQSVVSSSMLNPKIANDFELKVNEVLAQDHINTLARADDIASAPTLKGRASLAVVQAKDFIKNPHLHEEVFGPFSMIVECSDEQEMNAVGHALQGQLTITVFGTPSEIAPKADLIQTLSDKTGRLIFNGVPTGVEVCNAMVHGGPFPATSDARFTSVGTKAIQRFARPIAYQNWPDELLPEALQNSNPLGILRLVDNVYTTGALNP